MSTGSSRRLRLLLAVEEAAGLKALRLALDSGHEVVAVLTTPSEARGSSAWGLATERGLNLLDPALVKEDAFAERVRAMGIDLLINAHSLHIASAPVTGAPSIGSFNLHPGPLPDYRGLNSPSWAIFDDRKEHAVTLHWMTEAVDRGPVAYEHRFEIEPTDTGLKVSMRCVNLGLPLVERLLIDASTGKVPSLKQPDRPGTWHGRERPNDGWVNWCWPAPRVNSFVRASSFHPLPSPWGWPKTRLEGQVLELVATEASDLSPDEPVQPGQVLEADEGGVLVNTGGGCLLLKRVRVEGKTLAADTVLRRGSLLGE